MTGEDTAITPVTETTEAEAPADAVEAPAADADQAEAPADAEPAVNGFAALGLRPELLKALDELGYEEPTP
ncbi:MAG: ATP-dependent helicase, partial [Ilumatobacteraceae bacterium]